MLHLNVVNIIRICTIKYGSYLLRRTRRLFYPKNIIFEFTIDIFLEPESKKPRGELIGVWYLEIDMDRHPCELWELLLFPECRTPKGLTNPPHWWWLLAMATRPCLEVRLGSYKCGVQRRTLSLTLVSHPLSLASLWGAFSPSLQL